MRFGDGDIYYQDIQYEGSITNDGSTKKTYNFIDNMWDGPV